MSISWINHRTLINHAIFLTLIYSCFFLRRGTTTGDQDFHGVQSNRSRALIKLKFTMLRQLFHSPLIFIDVVAEWYFWVNIVTKQVNFGCIMWASFTKAREFEQCFFDRTVVVNMDSIFEDVVHKVRIRLDEIIKLLKCFELLSLLIMEQIKRYIVAIYVHVIDSFGQISFLVSDFLVSLLQALLLTLQAFDFFINLIFHHLEQILLLNFKLLHDSSEWLLKMINFFIKLLSNFKFKFTVQFFWGCSLIF